MLERDCYLITWEILRRNTNLKELVFEDFHKCWLEYSHRGPNDERTIEYKDQGKDATNPSGGATKFAKLLFKCARKSVHLSIPVQTFAPVSL